MKSFLMSWLPIKVFFSTILTSLLLSSCVSTTSVLSEGNIYPGMSKKDLRSELLTTTFSDDPFLDGCFRKYYPESKQEIIASESRSVYFVFTNVSIPSSNCDSSGDGVLGNWSFSFPQLSNSILSTGDINTNNSSEESLLTDNCPSNKNAEWHNCLGTYVYEDGTTYSGDWMSNKPHGQGNLIYPSGDKYSGSFKNGKMHGHGTYTYENGDMYAGDWKEGIISGNGVFSWANGDNYFGEFKDGKRHGQGNLVLSNGDNISGLWSNNEIVKDESLDGETTHQKNSKTDHKTIPVSSGTGFAITQNGHLVSNYHVIDGCQDVLLQLSNKDVHLNIIDHDSQNDIVLLKGDFYSNKFLPLSNEGIELLEDIYVAGYPFGDVLSSSVKVTKGIVSSLKGIGNNSSNFQIDAALQPGNSGGAIVNTKGNVIGVAVAKLDQKVILENFGVIPENTNFGIRTNVIKNMISANEITLPVENKRELQKKELGKNLSEATYLLSCRMTLTQIKKMESKKVMFKSIKH